MPFFETRDGVCLFYTDWSGADRSGQTVVFIHGLAISSDMWEYQMLHLSEQGTNLRCIAYDHRGCGRSDQPGYGYDLDTLADDLAGLLEHLDLRGVMLVGYSLAGGVIARYLSRYGTERIARVALVASTTPFLLRGPDNPDGVDRSLIYDSFTAGLRDDRPGLYAAITPTFFGLDKPGISLSQELVEWAIGLTHRASPKVTVDLYRAVNETDLRPDMTAFTVPTLILHGSDDAFSPAEATARRTAQAIPGSCLKVYEGAAHGFFLTHRERLSVDLLAFLREE